MNPASSEAPRSERWHEDEVKIIVKEGINAEIMEAEHGKKDAIEISAETFDQLLRNTDHRWQEAAGVINPAGWDNYFANAAQTSSLTPDGELVKEFAAKFRPTEALVAICDGLQSVWPTWASESYNLWKLKQAEDKEGTEE